MAGNQAVSCLLLSLIALGEALDLVVDIHFPESLLNVGASNEVFWLNVYSCIDNGLDSDGEYIFSGPQCPGGEWFAGSNANNFVITGDMRVSPDLFRTTIPLGEVYRGDLFVSVSNALSDVGSSVVSDFCDVDAIEPICFQIGPPYVVEVGDGGVRLSIHPAFGKDFVTGEVTTLFVDYDSSFGVTTNVVRDIFLYSPPSLRQNPLRRKMNVLVVNDGSGATLEAFMRNGLDVGLLNGILPETIMVGIPQDGDPLSFLPPFLHSSFPPFLPSFLPLPSFLSSCIHSPFPSSFLLEGRIASGSTN
jgi:hypothetical protein